MSSNQTPQNPQTIDATQNQPYSQQAAKPPIPNQVKVDPRPLALEQDNPAHDLIKKLGGSRFLDNQPVAQNLPQPDNKPNEVQQTTTQGASGNDGNLAPQDAPQAATSENLPPPSEPQTPQAPFPEIEEDRLADEIEALPHVTERVKKNTRELRKGYKTLKEAHQAVQTQLQAKEQELENYKKGTLIPEEIERLTNKAREGERYKMIVDLRASDAYQAQVAEPMAHVTERLKTIANDYKVDPKLFNTVLSLQSEAEINRLLGKNFDAVGAVEVKSLINQYKDIEANAAALEQEPGKALEELNRGYMQAREAQRAQNRSKGNAFVKNAFEAALTKIQAEGKMHELIFDPVNETHNKTIVEPLMQKAATEYARLANALFDECGAEQITPAVAEALANATLLAIGSGVAVQTRHGAEQHAQKIMNDVKRTASYMRPPIGSQAPGNPGAAKYEAPSRQTAVAGILDQAMKS